MELDLTVVYIIIQIIFLEGILSIDNAAVLGAMVSGLPQEDKVPWPGPLHFLADPIHRLLGGQRSAALKVGLLGAYLGEVIRRRWGGQWTLESALHARPTIMLRLPWDEEIDPTLKVYGRLTRGPVDDVWLYYRVLQQAWSIQGALPDDLPASEE